MKTETINQNRTLTTVIHLSVFTKYFFPLGNFIIPTLLWLSKRRDPFVDHHGRNALNFQISVFLFTVLVICSGIAFLVFFGLKMGFDYWEIIEQPSYTIHKFSDAIPIITTLGVFGILLLGLFILELFAVINASIHASEGKLYNYPLTINFIGSANADHYSNHSQNQSENEQFNSTQNQAL